MSEAEDRIPDASLLAYHAEALPHSERRALAERIDGDPEARALLAEWARQDAALQSLFGPLGEEALPPPMADLIEEARADPAPRHSALPELRRFLAASALIALVGGALGWVAHDLSVTPTPDAMAEAARAYRTYVVEAQHPVEVPATDRHLASWVSQRLGHPIQAPDLASEGFALMGGRVLPSAAGAAALFMYQNPAGRRVALYIMPRTNGGRSRVRYFETAGADGFWWRNRGLSFAITGIVPRETLRRIANMAYDQML